MTTARPGSSARRPANPASRSAAATAGACAPPAGAAGKPPPRSTAHAEAPTARRARCSAAAAWPPGSGGHRTVIAAPRRGAAESGRSKPVETRCARTASTSRPSRARAGGGVGYARARCRSASARRRPRAARRAARSGRTPARAGRASSGSESTTTSAPSAAARWSSASGLAGPLTTTSGPRAPTLRGRARTRPRTRPRGRRPRRPACAGSRAGGWSCRSRRPDVRPSPYPRASELAQSGAHAIEVDEPERRAVLGHELGRRHAPLRTLSATRSRGRCPCPRAAGDRLAPAPRRRLVERLAEHAAQVLHRPARARQVQAHVVAARSSPSPSPG